MGSEMCIRDSGAPERGGEFGPLELGGVGVGDGHRAGHGVVTAYTGNVAFGNVWPGVPPHSVNTGRPDPAMDPKRVVVGLAGLGAVSIRRLITPGVDGGVLCEFGNRRAGGGSGTFYDLSLIHISEPTRLLSISYAVFCLKKKTK